jgi:hypothetical protein
MCPPGAPPVAADYPAALVDDLLRGAAARPEGD